VPVAASEDGVVFPNRERARLDEDEEALTPDPDEYPTFRRPPVGRTSETRDDERGDRLRRPRIDSRQSTALASASGPPNPKPGGIQTGSLLPVAKTPRLAAPPVSAVFVSSSGRPLELEISRVAVCREVVGYDEVRELDVNRLMAGQALVVYASLANFQSQAGQRGYRTHTRSTVELRNARGSVVSSDVPREAVDLYPEPRHEYALAHDFTIPSNLPPGEYVLRVDVEDVLAKRRTEAQLPIRIQGGS
jgi:hypothetical protein